VVPASDSGVLLEPASDDDGAPVPARACMSLAPAPGIAAAVLSGAIVRPGEAGPGLPPDGDAWYSRLGEVGADGVEALPTPSKSTAASVCAMPREPAVTAGTPRPDPAGEPTGVLLLCVVMVVAAAPCAPRCRVDAREADPSSTGATASTPRPTLEARVEEPCCVTYTRYTVHAQ
jgi:hypothetical protein